MEAGSDIVWICRKDDDAGGSGSDDNDDKYEHVVTAAGNVSAVMFQGVHVQRLCAVQGRCILVVPAVSPSTSTASELLHRSLVL